MLPHAMPLCVCLAILQVWHELCEYEYAVNDYTAALHNQTLTDDDSVTLYR
jgi:hypothetical protein